MTRKAQRGLTLPELLIALFVFALISSAAVYALRLAIEGREQFGLVDGDIRSAQILRIVLKEDLAQIADRPTRDQFGAMSPAAFYGGAGLNARPPVEGEVFLLGLVRRGWDNPEAEAPRSSLIAVDYVLAGDRLIRRTRPYLDDARGQPRSDRVMAADVRSAGIAFLAGETNAGFTWVDLWPSPQARAKGPPVALRLTLETARFGSIDHLFWIGGSGE